jgi:hypothetical protein
MLSPEPMNGREGPRVRGNGLSQVAELARSPAAAFAGIRENPAWLGPVVLCLLLTLLGTWISLPVTLRAEAQATRAIHEKFGLGREALAEALERIPDPEALTFSDVAVRLLMAGLGLAVTLLIAVLVFHFLGRAFGTTARFRHSLALYFLAYVASAVGALFKGVLMVAAGTIDVTLGPGALVPGLEVSSVAGRLLDLADIFSLLNLYLLAVGAEVVYRVGRGVAWGLAGSFCFLKAVLLFTLGLVQTFLASA